MYGRPQTKRMSCKYTEEEYMMKIYYNILSNRQWLHLTLLRIKPIQMKSEIPIFS